MLFVCCVYEKQMFLLPRKKGQLALSPQAFPRDEGQLGPCAVPCRTALCERTAHVACALCALRLSCGELRPSEPEEIIVFSTVSYIFFFSVNILEINTKTLVLA